MIKPVPGYTLIDVKEVGGTSLITSSGEKVGAKKQNIVVAVSKKDEVEWEKGDQVALGEGAAGFTMEEGSKKYVLMPNSFIIAVL